MVAEGQVYPDHVGYNGLPWKFAAGTPNILGTIASAQALRLLVDLALHPDGYEYFGSERALAADHIATAMTRIADHTRQLVGYALDRFGCLPGVTIYGPSSAERRASLVAFNISGWSPFDIAGPQCSRYRIEQAVTATLPTITSGSIRGGCQLSFYLYNTMDEVEFAANALARIIAGR
jgi:cysteine desulfurase/selenocysteine lyase